MKNKTESVQKRDEAVNNPSHYSPNGVDSFMHMKDQMGPAAVAGFLQGNVIKYVQRHAFKAKPVEDLCKAAFYLMHLAFESASEETRQQVLQKLADTLRHTAGHYGLLNERVSK